MGRKTDRQSVLTCGRLIYRDVCLCEEMSKGK